jgi:hypothetical protein
MPFLSLRPQSLAVVSVPPLPGAFAVIVVVVVIVPESAVEAQLLHSTLIPYDSRFDPFAIPVLLNPDSVCTVAKAADKKCTYELAAALNATRSMASMFIFKIEPSEPIFVLDLNPDLVFVSGSSESASALARLALASVIANLSETSPGSVFPGG